MSHKTIITPAQVGKECSMHYAIMEIWPQDAAGSIKRWTTVEVIDTFDAARSMLKPGQVAVLFNAHREYAADCAYRRIAP